MYFPHPVLLSTWLIVLQHTHKNTHNTKFSCFAQINNLSDYLCFHIYKLHCRLNFMIYIPLLCLMNIISMETVKVVPSQEFTLEKIHIFSTFNLQKFLFCEVLYYFSFREMYFKQETLKQYHSRCQSWLFWYQEVGSFMDI